MYNYNLKMYNIFIKYKYIIMYENNLQYHSIENFKRFKKKFRIKKLGIGPIKKTIIKPISSGTVGLGKTVGSGTVGLGKTVGSGTVDLGKTVGSGIVGSEPVIAEDDYNEIDNDDELLLDNDDEGISTTFIIIIFLVILLISFGLYFLI
jgi:hypothetical protein